MFYVYNLIDPRDNSIFYVGKGKGNRMFRHEQYTLNNKLPNGNKFLFDKIKEIKTCNLEIVYKKVFETEDEMLAYEFENKIINEIGIDNLCNSISDQVLIGIANNTRGSNWYHNSTNNQYKLLKETDVIPDGYIKGSPRTKTAMENWWSSLSEEDLKQYKIKMSNSLKNSEIHKQKVTSNEYREILSKSIKSSNNFKKYNEDRKGKKRGKYKNSEKQIKRRVDSILLSESGVIIKEFSGLNELCDFFNIKSSTACVWLKTEKHINGMILKRK